MSHQFIVVFKKGTAQSMIDKEADAVRQNGGKVTKTFDSIILRGFTAEIPEAYLMMLQSSLTQADSPISYIEPDSTVKIQ